MCGRFSLAIAPDKLAELFKSINFMSFQERYNIAPTQPVLGIRASDSGRKCEAFRWGLIPFWAKDIRIGQKMTNARSETLHEKPSFRGAYKYRRCILPATGFYEWKTQGKHKQPYHIRLRNQAPMAMAGLWEIWTDPGGSELASATIITTRANTMMEPLHHRMPVLLDEKDYDRWLDPALQHRRDVEDLLKPCASETMEAYPVSPSVNRVGYDEPDCLEPYEAPMEKGGIQGELF